jgi:hypothetical protein
MHAPAATPQSADAGETSSTAVGDLEAGNQERQRLLCEPLPRSDEAGPSSSSSSSSTETQRPEAQQAEASTSGQDQAAERQELPSAAAAAISGRRSGFPWDLLSPPYHNASWLKLLQLSNSLSFLVLLFLNVATNSEVLWPSMKSADAMHTAVLTPAGCVQLQQLPGEPSSGRTCRRAASHHCQTLAACAGGPTALETSSFSFLAALSHARMWMKRRGGRMNFSA